jgi:hypothetical protein
MKQIAIVILGLSVTLAPPAAAQSTAPGVQSAAPLPTVKVQPSRKTATGTHARAGQGQGTHRTAGYEENDITAAKFGSKHWWTVQGWQSGGSSGNPR